MAAEKYMPLDDDPARWSTGPLRFVECGMWDERLSTERTVRILQTYVWRLYTPEYQRENKPQVVGDYGWHDVPLKEET